MLDFGNYEQEILMRGVGSLPSLSIEDENRLFLKPTCADSYVSRKFRIRNNSSIQSYFKVFIHIAILLLPYLTVTVLNYSGQFQSTLPILFKSNPHKTYYRPIHTWSWVVYSSHNLFENGYLNCLAFSVIAYMVRLFPFSYLFLIS